MDKNEWLAARAVGALAQGYAGLDTVSVRLDAEQERLDAKRDCAVAMHSWLGADDAGFAESEASCVAARADAEAMERQRARVVALREVFLRMLENQLRIQLSQLPGVLAAEAAAE